MAKKPILVPDELVKIIDKAKKEVFICFSSSPIDWQKEEVISAITRALDRRVKFMVLAADHLIDYWLNSVYRYLKCETLPHHPVDIYTISVEPIIFFILADKKDFLLGGDIVRRGDRVSGNYLCRKFMEAISRSKRIEIGRDYHVSQ